MNDFPSFKGKIYMTQAMAQIGRSLLLEFVKMCEKRDQNSFYSKEQWIEEDQMYEICNSLGVQDWHDIYTAVDVETMFEKYVVELSHNEIKTLQNVMQI